jgi:hypothetical protein
MGLIGIKRGCVLFERKKTAVEVVCTSFGLDKAWHILLVLRKSQDLHDR